MRSEVKEAGAFERLIVVTLNEAEIESAKTEAARRLSKDMKIKGFRPGKAPRRIVEATVGADTLRTEAIEHALPQAVGTALEEAELAPVTRPTVTEIRDIDDGVEVDVTVTLWPTIDDVPPLEDRRVTIEPPAVGDDEIDAQLERLQNQFAELEDVERAADEGDFVLINLTVSHNGLPIEEATANDLLYEVGSRSFLPGLDEALVASAAGDIKKHPTVLPEGLGDHGGEPAEATVLVKGVRAKKLPELTDEFVSDISEFDTLAELRADLEDGLLRRKAAGAQATFREKALDEVVASVEVELPKALVEAEMESSLHNLMHRLEQQGVDLATYISVMGVDQETFIDELREGAVRSLKTRILLDAVIKERELTVEAEEIDADIARLAAGTELSVEEVKARMVANGQGELLASDILRRKAVDLIIAGATPVDEDDNEVDLSLALEPDAEAPDAEASDAGDAESDSPEDDNDNVEHGPAPAEEETA